MEETVSDEKQIQNGFKLFPEHVTSRDLNDNASLNGHNKLVSIRCTVESVDRCQNGSMTSVDQLERDQIVQFPSDYPYDDVITLALVQLGYTVNEIVSSKGSIQVRNWKPVGCDSVTDDVDATIGEILGEMSHLLTLRIRIHNRQCKSTASASSAIKDKLLSYLLRRFHNVLVANGCPLEKQLLDHFMGDKMMHSFPDERTVQAFENWKQDSSTQSNVVLPISIEPHSNDESEEDPKSGNGVEGHLHRAPNGFSKMVTQWKKLNTTSEDKVKPGVVDKKPKTIGKEDNGMKVEMEQFQPDLNEGDDDREINDESACSSEADQGESEREMENEDRVKKEGLKIRIPVLPNKNAVYVLDAMIPEKLLEEEKVEMVPPEDPMDCRFSPLSSDSSSSDVVEMPGNEEVAGSRKRKQSFSRFEGCFDEPTDLSVPKRSFSNPDETTGSDVRHKLQDMRFGSQSGMNSVSALENYRFANGSVSNIGRRSSSATGSRTPSPHPGQPNFMLQHQNHFEQFQQQQRALQLAAMSRVLSLHYANASGHLRNHLPNPLGSGALPVLATPDDFMRFASVSTTDRSPQAGSTMSMDSDQKKRSRVFIDPLTEIPKLEKWFAEDTHPSSYMIEKFTDELNRSSYRQRFPKLEPKNLQLWFKNHRAKMKRHRDMITSPDGSICDRKLSFPTTPSTPGDHHPELFLSDWRNSGHLANACKPDGFRFSSLDILEAMQKEQFRSAGSPENRDDLGRQASNRPVQHVFRNGDDISQAQ